MKKEKSVTLTLNKELFFSVLLHRVWRKHPVNVDFLGIYAPPIDKFSPRVHGLLGTVFRLSACGRLGLWLEAGKVAGKAMRAESLA